MDMKEDERINEDGSTIKITTITKTPEDGWAKSTHMGSSSSGLKHNAEARAWTGYSKSVKGETNDPKIIGACLYGASIAFIIVGLLFIINRIDFSVKAIWCDNHYFLFILFEGIDKRSKENKREIKKGRKYRRN